MTTARARSFLRSAPSYHVHHCVHASVPLEVGWLTVRAREICWLGGRVVCLHLRVTSILDT